MTLFSICSLFASAKTTTETVKVWGNCEMCKTRIEKAAKLAGATSASWNVDTHILTVSFDDTKTSLASIESKIALVGHDTQHVTASDEAYNKLSGCCQYERKQSSAASASCCAAGASCCTSGQACCSKSGSALRAETSDCCTSGASCCSAGKNCCTKSETTAAMVKDCCHAGASCCAAGAPCCNKTAKVISLTTAACCATGADCCKISQDCCAKIAA